MSLEDENDDLKAKNLKKYMTINKEAKEKK